MTWLDPLDAPAAMPVATGWAPLADTGYEVTVEPLRVGDGYAHLTYREALAVAALLCAELPTREHVVALHETGLELSPVILPTQAMVRAETHAPPGSAEYEHAAQRLRVAHMSGPEWCAQHDDAVRAQLDRVGWDGARPVANAGKLWIAGAAPGKGRLMGWWLGGRFIQAGYSDPHNDLHSDYATLTQLVRRLP